MLANHGFDEELVGEPPQNTGSKHRNPDCPDKLQQMNQERRSVCSEAESETSSEDQGQANQDDCAGYGSNPDDLRCSHTSDYGTVLRYQ